MEPTPLFSTRKIVLSQPVLSFSFQFKLSTWKLMEILQLAHWIQSVYCWLLGAFSIIVSMKLLRPNHHPAAVMVQETGRSSASSSVGGTHLEQHRSRSRLSESSEELSITENYQELHHRSVSLPSASTARTEKHLDGCQYCSSSSSSYCDVTHNNNLENPRLISASLDSPELVEDHMRHHHCLTTPSSASTKMIQRQLGQCQCSSSPSSDMIHNNTEHHSPLESSDAGENQRNQRSSSSSASPSVIQIHIEHFQCHSSPFSPPSSANVGENYSESRHSPSSLFSETAEVIVSHRKHRRSTSESPNIVIINDHLDHSCHSSPNARKDSSSDNNSVASPTVLEHDLSHSKLLSSIFRSPCDEPSSDEESFEEIIFTFMQCDDDDGDDFFLGDGEDPEYIDDNGSICFDEVDYDLISYSEYPATCSEETRSKKVRFADSLCSYHPADDYDRENDFLRKMRDFRHAIELFQNESSNVFSDCFRQKIYQERFHSTTHSAASV